MPKKDKNAACNENGCDCGTPEPEVHVEDSPAGELDTQKEMFLRMAAEFDNYKKRVERERGEMALFIKAQTLKALLPAVDNLNRAINAEAEDDNYVKGVQMSVKGMMDALPAMGLEEINPAGEQFDPSAHEAVMHVEDGEVGENTVVEVLQPGYHIKDMVIRPAMVKVAN